MTSGSQPNFEDNNGYQEETANPGISGEVTVSPDTNTSKSSIADAGIKEAVLRALKSDPTLQDQQINVKVEDGVVRLEGEVDWEFQRINERITIENLVGVRAVLNLITVKSRVTSPEVNDKISRAFHTRANADANKISAELTGSRVTLRGMVRSAAEKEVAESAAWSVAGITNVENMLEIEMSDNI